MRQVLTIAAAVAALSGMACDAMKNPSLSRRKPTPERNWYTGGIPVDDTRPGTKAELLWYLRPAPPASNSLAGLFSKKNPDSPLLVVEVNGIRAGGYTNSPGNPKIHELLQKTTSEPLTIRVVMDGREQTGGSSRVVSRLYEVTFSSWDAGLIYKTLTPEKGSNIVFPKPQLITTRIEFSSARKVEEAILAAAKKKDFDYQIARNKLFQTMLEAEEDYENPRYLQLKVAVDKAVIMAEGRRTDDALVMVKQAWKVDVHGVNHRLVSREWNRLLRIIALHFWKNKKHEAIEERIKKDTKALEDLVMKQHNERLAAKISRARTLLGQKRYFISRQLVQEVLRIDRRHTDAKLLLVDISTAVRNLPPAEKANLRTDSLAKGKSALAGGKALEAAERASEVLFFDSRDAEARKLFGNARKMGFAGHEMPEDQYARWTTLLGNSKELAKVLAGLEQPKTDGLYWCVGIVTQYAGKYCIVDATRSQGLLWAFEDTLDQRFPKDTSISTNGIYVGRKKFKLDNGGELAIPVIRTLKIVTKK